MTDDLASGNAAMEAAPAELLTLAETVEFLGISKQTLYRLLERGALKGMKVGRQWRFRKPDLAAYLARGPVATTLSTVPEEHVAQAVEALTALFKNVDEPLPPVAQEIEDLAERQIDRLLRGLIVLAVRTRASDIHLEPVHEDSRQHLQARLRIDGMLHETIHFPISLHPAMLQRVKLLGGMSLEERSLPQDGRMHVRHAGDDYDLRVSVIPSILGEAAVMRLLFKGYMVPGLDKLYTWPEDQARMRDWLHRPSGLIVVSGPTGSGKTTMLYSCLMEITRPSLKVLSVEDPVEYMLPGVIQVAVNRRAGLIFPHVLRAFLRQDPDVIMCGEVRDLETAGILMQAALTGHLVLTTLHAPDALAAALRLRDMGNEPFIITESLVGLTGQRLVRCICKQCRQPAPLPSDTRRHLQQKALRCGFSITGETTFYRGAGCENCHGTGYRGRIAIYELAEFTPSLREAFLRGADHAELVDLAVRDGMRTLVADGLRKAAEGITTIEEVMRVVS